MKSQTNLHLNWTNNTKIETNIIKPKNLDSLKKAIDKKKYIAAGNQRSYGDMAISKHNIISMKKFNKILKFDERKGVIEVQSGVLLIDILKKIIDKGWFFPVTPGTKYVSIGGMIANNIHGKNTRKNQIKHFLQDFEIVLENKKIIKCSKNQNKKIFDLTVGGFGLTGIIISAKIKLKKISSSYISQKIEKFNNYDQLFLHLKKMRKYDYYVSWVRSFDINTIKGLSYFGDHNEKNKIKTIKFNDKKLSIFHFLFLKLFSQNYYGMKILNYFYMFIKGNFYKNETSLNYFFYPQDNFTDWNKIYGKNGFIEIQFLVNKKKFKNIMGEISNFLKNNRIFSPLIVIKNLNEKGSYLNFCGNGISVSMDVPIDKKFKLIEAFFNNLFIKYKCNLNLAKDSITKSNFFKKNRNYEKFKKDLESLKRKKISSIFSTRLQI